MQRTQVLGGLIVLVVVAAGCSGSGDDAAGGGATDSTAPAVEVVDENPTFVPGECWWRIPGDFPADVTIACGTVDVPADRADSGTDTLTLAVARVHKTGDPAADPVLVLHGGPGGAALTTPPAGFVRLDTLAERDIVLFDQRGAGRSTPSLNCPEKEAAVLDSLNAADPFPDELQRNRDAVLACRERLVTSGIDLNQYNTLTSVADIESLRSAMKVDRWNLYGGSYGTRLGLAYAREHPEQVRSLMIDSVYGTEIGDAERVANLPVEALGRLTDACADDEACTTAFGDLAAKLDQATQSLDERPEVVTQTVELNGAPVERTFTITGADFRGGLFSALYRSDLIPALPSIISNMAAGDRSIIPAYISLGLPLLVGLSEGAYYSVDCADGGRLLGETDIVAEISETTPDALFALPLAQLYCADWDVEPLPESFNEQALPDVPTLVLGGTLDPITPYTDSRAQAEAMPDARMITVPRGGHGVTGFNDCTLSAVTTFWSDPTAALPACVDSIEPTPFTVPAA